MFDNHYSRSWFTIAAAPFANIAKDQFFGGGPSTVGVATKKRDNDMTGVTNDYDRQVQYRRKRMPWRKKRRWVNFIRRVKAVDQSTWQTTTTIRNNTMQYAWDTADQRVGCAVLYGFAGTTDIVDSSPFTALTTQTVGNTDIKDIMLASGGADGPGEDLRFTSGVLDLTFTNRGTDTNNGRLEVDVYEIIFTGMESGVSLIQDYTEGFTVLSTNKPATYGTYGWTTRGVTPFENPQASAQGYKVIKKTKFLLNVGESFTYQKRKPGNFNVSGAELFTSAAGTSTEAQYKGKTMNIVFVMKGLPGSDYSVGGSQLNCAIGVTRTYKYKGTGDIEKGGGTL